MLEAAPAHAPVVVERGASRTRRPRARCDSTRSRTGSCRSRAPRAARGPRASGGSGRSASPLGSTQPEPGRVLPLPPVVVPVAAFDLVRGGGGAPAEPSGKVARRHGRARYLSAMTGVLSQMGRCPRPPSTISSTCSTSSRSRSTSSAGTQPDEERQRVFGGQVAGQALVAAARTVEPPTSRVRALAARVLPAPGRPDVADPLRGRPHPRRHGRSPPAAWSAIQHGKAIFNLQASFHVHEEASTTSCRCRRASPTPTRCPTSRTRMAPYKETLGIGIWWSYPFSCTWSSPAG